MRSTALVESTLCRNCFMVSSGELVLWFRYSLLDAPSREPHSRKWFFACAPQLADMAMVVNAQFFSPSFLKELALIDCGDVIPFFEPLIASLINLKTLRICRSLRAVAIAVCLENLPRQLSLLQVIMWSRDRDFNASSLSKHKQSLKTLWIEGKWTHISFENFISLEELALTTTTY